MPVSQGTLITAGFYSTMQASISGILGPSGYNQTVTSVPVIATQVVTALHWNKLRADINACRTLQTGSPFTNSELPLIVVGNIIYASVVNLFEAAVNIVQSAYAGNLVLTNGAYTHVRTVTWTSLIDCEIAMDFGTIPQANAFFQNGGDLRMALSQAAPSAANDTVWANIFNSVGTLAFTNSTTTRTGWTGTTNAIGWNNLSSAYQVIFSATPSGGGAYSYYANNSVIISMKKNPAGTGAIMKIAIENGQSGVIHAGTTATFGFLKTVAATSPTYSVANGNAFNDTVSNTFYAPTIALTTNITADDIISLVEAGQSINITGTVGGDAQVSNPIVITSNNHTYTGQVQPGLTFSIPVPGSDLAADQTQTVTARVTRTDVNGNSGTAIDSESYGIASAVFLPAIVLVRGAATTTSLAYTWAAPVAPSGTTLAHYAYTVSGPGFNNSGTTTVTNYTATGLTANTSYTISVTAVYTGVSGGTSAPSTDARSTSAVVVTYNPPTNLEVFLLSYDRVGFTWNVPFHPLSQTLNDYLVRMEKIIGGQVTEFTTTNPSYTVFDLEPGTAYAFDVIARYTGGQSSASSPGLRPVQTTQTPLQPPSNFAWDGIATSNNATFTWASAPVLYPSLVPSMGYRITVRLNGNQVFAGVAGASQTSINIPSLAASTNYTATIESIWTAIGNDTSFSYSTPSQPIAFSTNSGLVSPVITSVAPQAQSVTVQWAVPVNYAPKVLLGYTVELRNAANAVISSANTSLLTYTFTGLSPSTNYKVAVIARYTAGNSTPPTPLNAFTTLASGGGGGGGGSGSSMTLTFLADGVPVTTTSQLGRTHQIRIQYTVPDSPSSYGVWQGLTADGTTIPPFPDYSMTGLTGSGHIVTDVPGPALTNGPNIRTLVLRSSENDAVVTSDTLLLHLVPVVVNPTLTMSTVNMNGNVNYQMYSNTNPSKKIAQASSPITNWTVISGSLPFGMTIVRGTAPGDEHSLYLSGNFSAYTGSGVVSYNGTLSVTLDNGSTVGGNFDISITLPQVSPVHAPVTGIINQATNDDQIYIEWNIPTYSNTTLQGYNVSIVRTADGQPVLNANTTNNYTFLGGLTPGSYYNISISATYNDGNSSNYNTNIMTDNNYQTGGAAPVGGSIVTQSPGSVTVGWNPPTNSTNNSQITQYKFDAFTGTNSVNAKHTITAYPNNPMYTITGTSGAYWAVWISAVYQDGSISHTLHMDGTFL